jgi:uncharacterized membrane protein
MDVVAATDDSEVSDPDGSQHKGRSIPPRPRAPRFRYTLPGLSVALVFYCLSLTPSLLPRPGLLQGVISGVAAAFGYAMGVTGAYVWRAFANRDVRPTQRRSWRILAVIAVVAYVVFTALGRYWQSQIRELMGAPPDGLASLVVVPVVAAILFVGLVALSRALAHLYRWLASLLSGWIGPRAARAVGWSVVAIGALLVFTGVLLDGLVAAADQAFSLRNDETKEGQVQPSVTEKSGGPGSLISWESLGRQGRSFVASGPTADDIAAFTGSAALEPVRTYGGLESAATSEERARLAVDDLVRAGGFDREVLVVFTTTGSGWVDPGAVDAVDYMTGGDVATVAMQYSYLPSWLSYLVDQDRAREAGRQLFDEVYGRWIELPANDRPRLVVAGESLGSFGGETAFSGEYDIRNRTDGAIFAGPPNFNTLFREFVDDRDAGTLEVAPIYRDGRTVRFVDPPAGVIHPTDQPWDGTRVLYLMNASDPIVWWGPQLMFTRPDWLEEPPGSDVLDALVWIPWVTFWQVSADLAFSTGVPDGHGHVYTTEYVDAWDRVLELADWTTEQADQLRAIISASTD